MAGIDLSTAIAQYRAQAGITPSLVQPAANVSGLAITGLNPASTIGSAILSAGSLNQMQFPFDQTNRFFNILEGQITGAFAPTVGASVNYGNFTNWYRLPYPTVIQDTHDIKYDHNFNWLSQFTNLLRPGGTAGQIGSGFIRGATTAVQGLGYAVNNLKAVTLSVPNFRTFQLEFKLAPKTREESDMIQRMIVAMKTGMHPPFVENSADMLLKFPNIFLLWYNAGNEYLHKFKPCVFMGMQVNYQGDNPVPTFYRNPQNLAIPEAVVLRIACLELEIWVRENFEASTDAGTGLYNSDPFSALQSGTARNSPSGAEGGNVP